MSMRKRVTTGVLAGGLIVAPWIGAFAQTEEPETVAPTAFTGRMMFDGCVDGSTEVADGVVRMRGLDCSFTILEMSDPRLEGSVSIDANLDDRPGAVTVYMAAFRIEGDGGAWQEAPSPHFSGPDGLRSTKTIVFEGEGGYEGLTAVAELTNNEVNIVDIRGYIFEGDVPPLPDITTN